MRTSNRKENLTGPATVPYRISFQNAVIHPRNYVPLRNFLIDNLELTMWASSLRNCSHENPAILRNAIVLGLMTTLRSHCDPVWAYPYGEHGIDISGMKYVDTASLMFLRKLFGLLKLCSPGAQMMVNIENEVMYCFALTNNLTIREEQSIQRQNVVTPLNLID